MDDSSCEINIRDSQSQYIVSPKNRVYSVIERHFFRSDGRDHHHYSFCSPLEDVEAESV